MTFHSAFKPLAKDDVADALGVSVRTIENWVNDGTLPAPTKLGNRVYWHPGLFFSWLDRRLSVDSPTYSVSAEAHAPQKAVEPLRGITGGKSSKARNEREKLQRRTQAGLDSLLDDSAD